MKSFKPVKNVCIRLAVIIGILILLAIIFYALVLPKVVSSKTVTNFIEEQVIKTTGAELTIDNAILKTGFRPAFSLDVDKITLRKENENLLVIKDFQTELSFAKILKNEITLKKFGVDDLFVDVDKITALMPASKKKTEHKPISTKFDIFNSKLYINNCKILASLSEDTKLTLNGKHMLIEEKRNPKYVRFVIDTVISKNGRDLKISLNDNNKFYTDKKRLIIEECPLNINKSKIIIKSMASENKYAIVLESKDFRLEDGANLLGSNIFINNGSDIIAETKNLKGNIDFKLLYTKRGLNGDIKVKESAFNLRSLADMPVKVTGGNININPDLITLSDFSGYYANNKKNSLTLSGAVTDYYKSVDTKIDIKTIMTDDFTRKYLSKLAGCSITMTGDKPAGTLIKVFSKNNNVDVVYMAKLAAGNDILIEGASLSPKNYDRAITADIHLKGNILNIETIKYFIAKELNKGSKADPILTISGNLDIADNNNILNLGFDVPKPLPSEFLNVLIGQKLFRKGLISGNMEWINTGNVPVLKGTLRADKVFVPSQRLFIREGCFSTTNGTLNLNSSGKYKRSEYKLTGTMINKMVLPIIIKDIDFTIDNVDIERMMVSVAAPQPATAKSEDVSAEEQKAQENFMKAAESGSEAELEEADIAEDNVQTFIPGIIAIEHAGFHLIKGKYKDIEFGNLHASASLSKDGKLKIDSNRFDFADGHSSIKVRCDLPNSLFRVILGAKDIDSDKVASALLNLKREITGKASGIIDINTDKSLALNGSIKFAIFDGTIEKIGLVEYALNFVSLFRNPMAMVSPSTVLDLVNIPEGRFAKISGTLNIKNNVINRMEIISSAEQLSCLIMGRFDLISRDASLRIYTKFANRNKGVAGFLRNISLNSLANRVSLGAHNSDANYYAAELKLLPDINADEKDCQVFLTTVDGDVEHNNFLSSLKKIK